MPVRPVESRSHSAQHPRLAVTGPSPLRVAIWQPEARDERPADRLARLDAAIAAMQDPADLVVTPELFLSGYNRGEDVAASAEKPYGPSARAAAGIARRNGVALVLGYPEATPEGLYNSALCIDASGMTIGNYRKRHLVSEWERATFRRGQSDCLVEVAGWKIGVLICWDIEFPEEVRALARAGAALVVAPTALRRQWSVVARSLMPARAFENHCFIAYANHAGREGEWDYLGESVILDPLGEPLVRAASGEEMISAALDPAAPETARQAFCQIRELDFDHGDPSGGMHISTRKVRKG